ncbi:probable tRNA (uracil-O(2)-)-methyltransferase [Wyeomyia smithii]|uniref:probable tRNA (uracil-O(2)-)-methyltransferase n=1 Tax=Wyeomyia smithii TaxID=174621 RepID=UPI002467D077|nr:probable tRNA (uracil-O(2)-)-methyltransferase [Wyeomyia smithii]
MASCYKMFNNTLVTQNITTVTRSQFYRAVNIYLFKPHVINRKLFGVRNILNYAFRRTERQDPSLDVANMLDDFKIKFEENSNHEVIITELAQKYNIEIERLPYDIDLKTSPDEDRGYFIINRWLPRNLNTYKPLEMLSIVDSFSQSASFVCLNNSENYLAPKFAFSIQLDGSMLSIKNVEPSADSKSNTWLTEVLFQRLLKWIGSFAEQENQTVLKEDTRSLSLVHCVEEYNQLYGQLKAKYGIKMVDQWPEGTDPKKYVYEDVAIATYLLLLWKQEREFKGSDRLQSFVDVGCGNGLLVYILVCEGHNGFGIDLRKRKIWNLYPEKIKLIEKSLIPDTELFPQTDWIIGNHSDELSPWIPVLAAKSSYQCQFFLLPCCAFEFNGKKFQRQNSHVSQYNDFINYVEQISKVCGFQTAVDRLKIPSTKRICLVGSNRTYPESQSDVYRDNIQAFIKSRSNSNSNEGNCLLGFRPREYTEKVRNCTKVNRNVVDEIVGIAFNALIAKKRIACEFPGKVWNAGGTITISELVKMIDQDKLNHLKAECGGLQTLLKNNHQVFHVTNGCVQLRIPTKQGQNSKTAEELKKKVKRKNTKIVNLKERPCWHYVNHPDGCPFDEHDCKFKH